MKPGLTCVWQCAPKRNEIGFSDWMKMDLSCIDNWSLWLDFKILTPLQNVPFCPITASDTNFNSSKYSIYSCG